jgi:hypothetical protein
MDTAKQFKNSPEICKYWKLAQAKEKSRKKVKGDIQP